MNYLTDLHVTGIDPEQKMGLYLSGIECYLLTQDLSHALAVHVLANLNSSSP